MTFPSINRIKWKLTLVILGTSVAVLVLATIAVLIYDSINSRTNLLSHVDSMAEIVGANSSAALAFRNTVDAKETLDGLRAREEIDLACLYLEDATPFVHFARNGMTLDTLPNITGTGVHFFHQNRLFLKRDIYFGSERIGSIVICANMEQQNTRSKSFLIIALSLLAGLTGVALVLATLLQRLVSDPISGLATAARHITSMNDYSIRVPTKSTDEIGSLVTAFNQMLSEIERQNRTVLESESRLNLALSASQMGVWEWNVQTDTVTWSAENKKLFGDPMPWTTLSNFARRIHPDDCDWVTAALKQCTEQKAPFMAEYRVQSRQGETFWVSHHGQIRCDAEGKPHILAGIAQDASSRKQLDAEHQGLIARFFRVEEDERRRIARELHDTTAQHLAVLKFCLSQISGTDRAQPDPKLLAECRRILDLALQEIRTLAYLLHPPVLEEFGLVGALKDFALGISRRSDIRISVHSGEYEGRLQRNIELALFRVVQESVSNALRHSNTRDISIRLARDAQEVRVEIQDSGQGFSATVESSSKSGVGIASMQERLAMVGGILHIESDSEGVTVLASVPVTAENPKNGFTSPSESNP